ncbi:hypothetical protein ACFQ1L_09265 [Phytohabitans flavus]|uniref:hypothetical protein n=1 Tax=Phytohabitans flavus TaxID=1076124 RepID=UPI0036266608
MSYLEVAGVLGRRLGDRVWRVSTEGAPGAEPLRPIIHDGRAERPRLAGPATPRPRSWRPWGACCRTRNFARYPRAAFV